MSNVIISVQLGMEGGQSCLYVFLSDSSFWVSSQKKEKEKEKNTMRKHFGFWISIHHKACKMHIIAHFNLSVFYSNFICSVMILASLLMMDGHSLQVLLVLTFLCLLMSVCGPGALMHPIGTQIEYTCRNREGTALFQTWPSSINTLWLQMSEKKLN